MLFLRLLRAELKFSLGRLAIFAACLALGVAAVVATHGLADGVDRGVRRESRRLLAADLEVRSQSALAPDVVTAATTLAGERGGRSTPVIELIGLVGRPNLDGGFAQTVLCEIKAAGSGYPFYGEVVSDPPGALASLAGNGILAEQTLLDRLGVRVGDPVDVGRWHTRVLGVLRSEPDRLGAGFSLGPRVLLAHDDLVRTGLLGFGARATYKLLLELDAQDSSEVTTAAARRLRQEVGGPAVRVQSYTQAQPAIRNGLEQLRRFLSLVAILSLLLGGLGTSRAVALWVEHSTDDLATLRCLGVRPGGAAGYYGMLVVSFAFCAAILGAALGLLVLLLAPRFTPIAEALGGLALRPGMAIARGVVLGTAIGALFALPALTQIARIPPARAFRRDAEELTVPRFHQLVVFVASVVGIVVLVVAETGQVQLGLRFLLGLFAAVVALVAAGLGVVGLARRLRPDTVRSLSLRYALSAIARPGFEQVPALLAIGLAATLFAFLSFVGQHIEARLRADLPTAAPTMFFLDVQEDQWPSIKTTLLAAGATEIQSVPVITARIRAIDGIPVRVLVPSFGEQGQTEQDDERRGERPAGRRRPERWTLTREQRLTVLTDLPADNQIVAGALWSDPESFEISIEEEYAGELGVGLGDRIEFDIQGVPIELRVTSLRRVEWQSFGINFFLVAEPGALDGAPSFRLAAARVPANAEQAVQDEIAALHANVSPIRVRELIERVSATLARLRFAVRGVGSFVLLSALAVLAGTVAAGAATRRSEVALLRTLGMSRRRIRGAWAAEQAAIALLAAAIGIAAAWGTAWWLCVSELEIPWEAPFGSAFFALVVVVLTAVGSGLLASERTLATPPLATWRED